MKIEIILPHISDDQISKDLRHITKTLVELTGENDVQGFLGGEFGYGQEFRNDVFEMHPFWWGDCTCGWDDMQFDFEENNPHDEHCFQSELKRRNPDDIFDGAIALADERGISRHGCYSYCNCNYKVLEDEFYAEHPNHESGCKIVAPNFLHYASDFQVSWYKYIGRDMEVNRELTLKQWADILEECLNSLQN